MLVRADGHGQFGRRSVLRDARVDLPRPTQYTAAHAPHASKAGVLQIPHGERAPRAAFAIDGDRGFAIDARNCAFQAVQRYESGAFNAADLPLVRLAHIDELNRFAGSAPDGELARLDLRDGVETGADATDVGTE